jgi:hypothetical protein
VLDLVRGTRAFVYETAHRFRIDCAEAGSFANFVVSVKPLVANGNKMFAAERLAIERCSDCVATIGDPAFFRIHHISAQGIRNLRIPL